MKILNTLFSEEFIQALGWTLVHSIWQAAIFALMLGILMVVLQKSSKLRYTLAVGILPIILFTSLATFLLLYKSSHSYSPRKIGPYNENSIQQVVEGEDKDYSAKANSEQKLTVSQQFNSYFTSHFPLIITLWFLGMLILILKFLGALAYTQRLKRYKVIDITKAWEEKLLAISTKIGLQKKILLMESPLVSVPMVIGYIKPIILFPLGVISGLSTSQIESILAHEMAHVYRKDYLINIAQTIIEILFFYHPAIWWISSIVREERENCCDDIAVQVNENSFTYAKALTVLGEIQVQSPQLIMAAIGNKSTLYKRVKRLLTQTKQTPTFSEGFITAGLLVLFLCSITFIAKSALSSSYKKASSPSISIIHSMEEGDFNAVVYNLEDSTGKDNNLVIIKNKKGKIVELYVNGRKIPKSEIDNYKDLINQTFYQQEKHKMEKGKLSYHEEEHVRKTLKKMGSQDQIEANQELAEEPEVLENTEGSEKKQFQDFAKKTIEISKLGLAIGQLSMEKARLEKNLESGKDAKGSKLRNLTLDKEIKSLELKIEKLGKEIEIEGEKMSSFSIDIAKSALDSIDLNFAVDDDDNNDGDDLSDNDDDNDNQSIKKAGHYICPPCENNCDGESFEKAGNCPICHMKLVKISKTSK